MQAQQERFRRSYLLGMKSGNVEFGLWALRVYGFVIPYTTGRPLLPIVEECEKMVTIMEDLQQKEHTLVARGGLQLLLNLLGEAENELVLEGRALQPGADRSKPTRVVHDFYQSELYLFYGEYKLAAESALKRGDEFADVVSGSFVAMEAFHRAVALFAMARKTRESKYTRPANRLRNKIAKWAKHGNPNVVHYDCFLQAEHAALKGKYKDAKGKYEEAIKTAARTGHLHHAGLFNERYADLLHNDIGDDEESAYRLMEAIRWYGEWGAASKVKMLSRRLT